MSVEKINLFGIDYPIIREISNRSNDYKMGQCDSKYQKIVIAGDMSEAMQDQTILHEIIHLISDNLGIELSEAQTYGVASGLWDVGYKLEQK